MEDFNQMVKFKSLLICYTDNPREDINGYKKGLKPFGIDCNISVTL